MSEKRRLTEVPLPPPDPSRKGCPLDRDFAEYVFETLHERGPL